MTLSMLSDMIGNGVILLFVVGIPVYAHYRKVPVYDTFIEGAKEGLPMTVNVLPFFIGMLVAIGMLRASGAFDILANLLSPLLSQIGIPAEIIPVAIMRPFSGSGATALAADVIHTHGGNAFLSHLSAVILNATDATFYIVSVYCGAASIKHLRHALSASIVIDVVALLLAIWITTWLL